MEQGRTEEDMKQQQDHQNRLKPSVQSENPLHHPPQQPQKCPRCESLHTKFCYYNNYSLSQPRYFCKTCRRYWTQGGTLRNVPVGGGCRKGKRTKATSSTSTGENLRSQPSPPPQQQQPQVPQNLTTMATMVSANSGIPTSQALRNKELGNLALQSAIPSMGSYYSGGGFLSSLAAMQSLSQSQDLNHPLNVGGQFGGASNLALLQGFNVPSLRSHEAAQQQQSEFYQMGNRDKGMEPLYPSDQSLVQQSRPVGSWTQSYINTTNPTASNPSFWNSSTSNTTNSSTSGTSFSPNQWPDGPDLPGYGPPP